MNKNVPKSSLKDIEDEESLNMKGPTLSFQDEPDVNLEDGSTTYVYQPETPIYASVNMQLEGASAYLYQPLKTENSEEAACMMDDTYWLNGAIVVHTRESPIETNKVHKRPHCGEPFVCEWPGCSKVFQTSYGLKVHLRTHTGEKPFGCDFVNCKKAFRTSGDLQKHIRTHTGEKPYKCPIEGCGKAFTTSNICKVHIRTHTGEKPHKCAVCGKTFSNITNYRNHSRIHTGEKPFACTVKDCGKQFTEYSSLYKHQAVHRKLKCKDCGKLFRERDALLRHRMKIHDAKEQQGLIVEITAFDLPEKSSSESNRNGEEKCLKDDSKLGENGQNTSKKRVELPSNLGMSHNLDRFGSTSTNNTTNNNQKKESSRPADIFFTIPNNKRKCSNTENNSKRIKKSSPKSGGGDRDSDDTSQEFSDYDKSNLNNISPECSMVDLDSMPGDGESERNFQPSITMIEIDGQPFTLQLVKDDDDQDGSGEETSSSTTAGSSNIVATIGEGVVGTLVVDPGIVMVEPSDGFVDRFIVSDAPIEGVARPTTSRTKTSLKAYDLISSTHHCPISTGSSSSLISSASCNVQTPMEYVNVSLQLKD